MYNLSLKDNDITFNNLEKKIYKYVCNKACEFMKEVLTHLDRRFGKKAYKFLLDEYLKMDTIGHISSNLVQKLSSKIEEKEEI
ncbi:hypothetical protein H2684_11220 [Clostridium sp. cel8]|jgi:hypothetical protein|uniref:hypothetical protein n=1 Tax=Clostridium sp. cel8 TaxID=2663123 RepID=UPI0015F7082B|nr:hypothetical protein [Clostridium sp. cel8]MBA5851859.1 hypothetical protein [Clostridium sp. cel8]